MALFLNVVGRVGNDPKKEEFKGIELYNFSVAVDDYKNNQNVTVWVQCRCFSPNLFKRISTLKKGSLIQLQGKASLSAYLDSNGKPACGVSLTISDIEFIRAGRQNQEESSDSENKFGKEAMMEGKMTNHYQKASSSEKTYLSPSSANDIHQENRINQAIQASMSMSNFSSEEDDELPF